MNRINVGIELSDDAVKIVEYKKAKLKKYINEDLPLDIVKDGIVKAPEALSEFLVGLKNKYKLKKKLALVVPDKELSIRRLSIPAMTDEQIRMNIPYEFRDFISGEKNEYIYDYITVEIIENEEGVVKSMDILAVAIAKEIINKYKSIFKKAGFKLKYAIPYSVAIGNFAKFITEDNTEDFVVINLGYIKSKIGIYHKGLFDMSRDIDIGFKHFAEAVADIMSVDIHMAKLYLKDNKDNIQENQYILEIYNEIAVSALRSINYYMYQSGESTISNVFITGEGNYIKPLMNILKNELPFDIKNADECINDDVMKKIFIEAPAAFGILHNI